MNQAFLEDVLHGLSQPLKKLNSKYFYDEVGDKLFQQIMQLEEYYLPRCEREIIANKTPEIADVIRGSETNLDVVELGAGDGSKTVEMLDILQSKNFNLRYVPLDISAHILEVNQRNMQKKLPNLEVVPIVGDFFKTMDRIPGKHQRRLVLFMGSNIGNFELESAIGFLNALKLKLAVGDYLLVAFDLRKNPHTILKAYNDSKSITKKFNLNLLARINRELGADFNVEDFDHYPVYEPVLGVTSSYLVSLKKQTVQFPNGQRFDFHRDELIHMEISRKFSPAEIESLATSAGLKTVKHFLDSRAFYSLSLFTV